MTRFRSTVLDIASAMCRPSPMTRSATALLLVASLGIVSSAARAEPLHWHTDWSNAAAEAEASKRPILTVFTGSDWCPHCQLLERNVLETQSFGEWARGRVVLLMIDMPKRPIPQEVRQERSELCRRYGVSTFPNVVLIAADGTRIAAQPGYNRQSPETWIAAMDRKLAAGPPATLVASNDAEPRDAAAKATPIEDAVRQAEGERRPVLVVVSRSSDQQGRIRAASLVNDPSFREFARDHFVVTQVSTDDTPPDGETEPAKPALAEPVGSLLGGVPLPADDVEVIVTYDGRTPMYTQSARQPTPRLISALRRFLGARPAAVRR